MPIKRKKITLKYGKAKELAKLCGTTPQTVSKALAWNTDSEIENLVRIRARQYGFIKTSNMELNYGDIQNLVADSVQLGYMRAVRSFEPASDNVKGTDLDGWCLAAGVDKETLTKLIKRGAIKKQRTGTARNSPIVYSKSEIKQAMLSLLLSNINKRDL